MYSTGHTENHTYTYTQRELTSKLKAITRKENVEGGGGEGKTRFGVGLSQVIHANIGP